MGNEISLVNLGPLAKPIDTFIKKVSLATGGIFAPFQIKRIAKAKSEAALIEAETEIKISDLQRRAVQRFIDEETVKQCNIEAITSKAIPLIKENSDASKMDDDWVTNFFDKSRLTSDEEMRSLWAKVLAGEANDPGTYSKRTVNFLSTLDKIDASLFTNLCRFVVWVEKRPCPLIFNLKDEIYRKNGLTFEVVSHLDGIGLVRFDHAIGYNFSADADKFNVSYYDKRIVLKPKPSRGAPVESGSVMLTKLGLELASLTNGEEVAGFIEHIEHKWKDIIVKRTTKEG